MSMVAVKDFDERRSLLFASRKGKVKRTPLAAYSHPRAGGIQAVGVEEGDDLLEVKLAEPGNEVLVATQRGFAVRFPLEQVRAMGRTARGVRGIRLGDGHRMISLIIPQEGGNVLTASANGYGKRTPVTEFPTKGRGNKGVIAMSTSVRNGDLVGAVQVFEGDELMLISNQGTLVRTRADEISQLGRNTQGVRVIRTKQGEHLVGVERIDEPDPEIVFEGDD